VLEAAALFRIFDNAKRDPWVPFLWCFRRSRREPRL